MWVKYPDGALPLFIGGGDHEVVRGCRKCKSIIGLNFITIYLAQHFLDFSKPIKTIFGGGLSLLPESGYALGYWTCYIALCWLLLYFLYRQKIFLKV